jgi:predicted ribosome quality control (RQC) complex YloA/Tae2 family protein
METFKPLSHKGVNTLSTSNLCFVVRIGDFQYIVDNIMLTNYHTLNYIASSLNSRISGQTVAEIFSQERDQLAITFDRGNETLIVSCRPEENVLYLHPKFARAKSNTANLFVKCWGKKVRSVSILPSDRVVMIALESELTLCAQFFGSASNVLLVDQARKVIDAFKNSKKLIGAEYCLREGELMYDVTRLQSRLQEERSSAVASVLKNVFPTLGSTLIREILHRSGIPSATEAAALDDNGTRRITESVGLILSELAKPAPRVYSRHDGAREEPVAFSLINLRHLDNHEARQFDDVHEALRFFISHRFASRAFSDQKEKVIAKIMQQVRKLERANAAVSQDLQRSDHGNEYEVIGKVLMSNRSSLTKGMKSVQLPHEGRMVDVPLDARLSPIENAQKYFEKGKKARLALRESEARLEELRQKTGRAKELFGTLNTITTKDELKDFMAMHATAMKEFGLSEKGKEKEQPPFRIFTVDGGFEVWAGKSSANNDLLTMKHAKPNDLWFHARGSSGSHVVLKVGTGKGEVSKKAKEEAASIAAYYSKMKKASMVPVATTERKYVRKPKGAPPGTVILEREKVIFAEPRLPLDKNRHA